ncbi:RNA pseudouridine synthase 2, chloroplastic isoform X2 [Magnolia sinica]|uniref:RNA pseudouridine synthase 2, chloroplastic isoform X2 n=1 Tax=Magnolia sinica TaxID=86752 RepID=UPI00265AC72F|nr:RNA pseudouridine synthase 2, chloroplastic isoform X2 [Magnolia sinica]
MPPDELTRMDGEDETPTHGGAHMAPTDEYRPRCWTGHKSKRSGGPKTVRDDGMLLAVLPPSSSLSSPSSAKTLLRRNPRYGPSFSKILRSSASSSPEQSQQHPPFERSNYAGLVFEETVGSGSRKSRLDSWISSRIQNGVSRARIQSSIRSGLVTVNGRPINKVSHIIKMGDKVCCTISELQPLRAIPEDIPLDIIYEDAHVLVVNKPAHMVVHPAPGNANGTLVNGILHHCKIPTVSLLNNVTFSKMEDCSDNEFDSFSVDQNSDEDISSCICGASIRPGIVHRLDKGTSGLLVVAKDEHSHAHLSEQFKLHTIHRVYLSLSSGVPYPSYGVIDVPIARDPNNRIRMAAVSSRNNCRHARRAVRVGCALVEWRLETGRTHQIRAHAKYLGIPLLGDEVYGGTKSMALSLLRPRIHSSSHAHLSSILSNLSRPCLHAFRLGFKHPQTGEHMRFSCLPPPDFAELLSQLRNISTDKPKKLLIWDTQWDDLFESPIHHGHHINYFDQKVVGRRYDGSQEGFGLP